MRSFRAKLAPAFVVTVSLAGCGESAPAPLRPTQPTTNPPAPTQDAALPSSGAIDPNDRAAALSFGRNADGTCTVQRVRGEGSRAAVPTPCPAVLLAPSLADCAPAVLYRIDGKEECECHHFANPPIVEKRECPKGH